MPAGPMDALGAFSHLSENLPQWITRLSDLATYTAAKRAEYAEDFKKHAVVRPRRRKNSSICSIRTDECVADGPTQQPVDSKQLSSQIPKKRSTEEASFDDDDHDDDERYPYATPRHNLIIQYDGHTQKSLEEMVRHIGTARNNIRRGRMSQLPLGGFSGGAFGRGRRNEGPRLMASAVDTPEDELLSSIRSARARNSPGPAQVTTPKDSSFDIAEKHLEIAHSMCETAAYQFLRTGDCSTQLSSVEDKFQNLLDLANKEVTRLLAEQSNSQSEDEAEAADLAPVEPVKTADKPPAYSGEIEVDDGTASVESLDLTAFRASRLRRC